MKNFTFLILFLLFAFNASAAIHGEEIEYSADNLKMKGYLVYDDSSKGKRPGVLVVHEWWGHNEHARQRAKMLAEAGYIALAVDMYGVGKNTEHPEDAKKFVGEAMANMDVAQARFVAAMNTLKAQPFTDPDKLAAIGFCFGGGLVLDMARRGLDLDGVASFHGSYPTQTPAQPGKVKAAVLVLHGGADEFSTAADIEAFKKEMEAAKVNYQFLVYEEAKHSFTNPAADEMGRKNKMPIAYNAEADKKSWADLLSFLKKVFGK